jgi:hypothetical protein
VVEVGSGERGLVMARRDMDCDAARTTTGRKGEKSREEGKR